MRKKSLAFTLAEVLITLTIIGVIAAITIPNLIQKYKKHETEVKLKAVYSILTNALKLSAKDNGSFNDTNSAYSNKPNDWVNALLLPYLKVSKDYGVTNLYTPRGHKDIKGTQSFSGTVDDSAGRRYLLLNNGTLISIGNVTTYPRGEGGVVSIYANLKGRKELNPTFGKDLFLFTLYDDGILYGGHINGWKASIKNYNNAKTECYNTGLTCAQLIMQNGWKIPDDYPVKKF